MSNSPFHKWAWSLPAPEMLFQAINRGRNIARVEAKKWWVFSLPYFSIILFLLVKSISFYIPFCFPFSIADKIFLQLLSIPRQFKVWSSIEQCWVLLRVTAQHWAFVWESKMCRRVKHNHSCRGLTTERDEWGQSRADRVMWERYHLWGTFFLPPLFLKKGKKLEVCPEKHLSVCLTLKHVERLYYPLIFIHS